MEVLILNANQAAGAVAGMFSCLSEQQRVACEPHLKGVIDVLKARRDEEQMVLAEASMEDLFKELCRRGDAILLMIHRNGVATRSWAGPMATCIGMAEMARVSLIAQMGNIPYDDGSQKQESWK